MFLENVNIYDLLPSQITEIIEMLNKSLIVIKNKKQTMSKVAKSEIQRCTCPRCNSNKIVKNGHTKSGIQTYKCKDCNIRFNDLTNTVFSNCHLTYEQIEIFLQCFKDKISLRKTAKRMNSDKGTVHLLRLKIMNCFKLMRQNTKLSGNTESDEIYKSINLKGTKPKNMPRASKSRKAKGTSTRGISNHKVCIETVVDEHDLAFFEIVGTGPITSDMVKKSLGTKLGKVKKLITDCKSSYESLAHEKGLNLKQVKSQGHVDEEGNSLANINSLHSGLTTFLAPFRGVSTKHLQGYLDWYVLERYLNYTFEETKQTKEILKTTLTNTTDIVTSNMYDNYSGIDFYDVYSDYHFVPSRIN